MKDETSFESILEAIIEAQTLGQTHEPGSKPEIKTREIQMDFLSRLLFDDDLFRIKIRPAGQYKTIPKEKASPRRTLDFIGPQPSTIQKEERPTKTAPPPKPRVQRKLTFDQKNAIKVFAKFGEAKIDDWSTIEEIKGAYRKLARRYHPDVNAQSGDIFKSISSAYKKLIS